MHRLIVFTLLSSALVTAIPPSARAQANLPDPQVRITASATNQLSFTDQSGANARRIRVSRGKQANVNWDCCTLPPGETFVAFDIAFEADTPFCRGNNCTDDDFGKENNKKPRLTKKVKRNAAIKVYRYAVAVVSRDAAGNMRLYLEDPEIEIMD